MSLYTHISEVNDNHVYRIRPNNSPLQVLKGSNNTPQPPNGSPNELWRYDGSDFTNVQDTTVKRPFSSLQSTHGFERLIKVTGLTNEKGSPFEDYFSLECGNTDGGVVPNEWKEGMRKLYRSVYYPMATDADDPEDSQILYNLYGAVYNGTAYGGQFHTGVDIYKGLNSPIYCPFNGVLKKIIPHRGALVIESNLTCEIYVFMHMNLDGFDKEEGDYIAVGEQIGVESDVNSPGNVHLHVEILRPGTDVSNFDSTLPTERSYQEIGQTIPPYASFARLPIVPNFSFNPPTGGAPTKANFWDAFRWDASGNQGDSFSGVFGMNDGSQNANSEELYKQYIDKVKKDFGTTVVARNGYLLVWMNTLQDLCNFPLELRLLMSDGRLTPPLPLDRIAIHSASGEYQYLTIFGDNLYIIFLSNRPVVYNENYMSTSAYTLSQYGHTYRWTPSISLANFTRWEQTDVVGFPGVYREPSERVLYSNHAINRTITGGAIHHPSNNVPFVILNQSGSNLANDNQTRLGFLVGNYAYHADNGDVTYYPNIMVFNESEGYYFNPVTDTTTTFTNWTYDYANFAYTVTNTDGSTAIIRYGEQFVSIIEGDTVTNIYYIIYNTDPGGNDSNPPETPPVNDFDCRGVLTLIHNQLNDIGVDFARSLDALNAALDDIGEVINNLPALPPAG